MVRRLEASQLHAIALRSSTEPQRAKILDLNSRGFEVYSFKLRENQRGLAPCVVCMSGTAGNQSVCVAVMPDGTHRAPSSKTRKLEWNWLMAERMMLEALGRVAK